MSTRLARSNASSLGNSLASYDVLTKILHWITAVLIAGLYVAGLLFDSFPREQKLVLVGLHVSFGLIALALIFLRLLRRPTLQRPAANDSGDARYERLVAVGHVALYLLMVLVPVTGMMRRWGRGRALEFFGLPIPSPFGDLGTLGRTISISHEYLAHALAIVVAGHVAAALWHHFMKRDNVLRSMLPGRA